MNDQLEDFEQPKRRDYKVSVVAPTPFYYQIPLFKALASHPRIGLKVYFCSDEGYTGQDVEKKFRTEGTWGSEEELLEGYDYQFLRNYSPWPSYLKSLIGLLNPGIWRAINHDRPDIVILMSWMNPTWWIAILACVWFRIPILYLTDQNVQRDMLAPKWKISIKKLVLGKGLFRLTTGFLCAGTANRLLYKFYGVPDEKLVPFAFSWGYDKLLDASDQIGPSKNMLRRELGLPDDSYVVLYCGRLSPEKGPMNLLQAFEKIDRTQKELLFVGDGQLRQELENYVAENKIESVHFKGFQTRTEIPTYYAISDVLVLPSRQETWGIVVNEAMCFGLPVIVSDQVGAVRDLVRSGYNGFSFPVGDVAALSSSILRLMDQDENSTATMKSNSRRLIERWIYRDLAESLDQYFDVIYLESQKKHR